MIEKVLYASLALMCLSLTVYLVVGIVKELKDK